ncbi:MAG: hypothetical protein JNK54_01445 [Elusimicrobia bacterium]|jgi:hypothetical protein|nr:hypothetical protein [Elusimicrobiota bacterium]
MPTNPGPEEIANKLLYVLHREENAIISGRWEKLAPLDRLRTRLWKALGADPGQSISRKMAIAVRDQSDANTRLLAQALAEVGGKLMAVRRRSQANEAYGRV